MIYEVPGDQPLVSGGSLAGNEQPGELLAPGREGAIPVPYRELGEQVPPTDIPDPENAPAAPAAERLGDSPGNVTEAGRAVPEANHDDEPAPPARQVGEDKLAQKATKVVQAAGPDNRPERDKEKRKVEKHDPDEVPATLPTTARVGQPHQSAADQNRKDPAPRPVAQRPDTVQPNREPAAATKSGDAAPVSRAAGPVQAAHVTEARVKSSTPLVSSEVASNPSSFGNTALLERTLALGHPLHTLDAHAGQLPAYTERSQILTDTTRSLQQRYNALALFSITRPDLNITVPTPEEWNPQGPELDILCDALRPERIRMQMLDGIAEFVLSHGFMHRLLPQQRDAMQGTHNFMEIGTRMSSGDGVHLTGKSGYIDMPTGTGKTGVLVSVAQAVKLKENPNDPVKVLIVVPTTQLLKQTVGDKSLKPSERTGFAKFAPGLRPTEFYADVQELSDLTVMTNAMFNKLVQSGQLPDFDFVEVDESHTDLGENISDSVRKYYGDKVTIGFSATPDFHEDKMTAHLLEHEIFRLTLPDAIKMGRLAPVIAEHRDLELTFDEADLPTDPKERRRAKELAYFDARLEASMEDIIAAVKSGDGVLVRCPAGGDIAFAHRAQDKIRERIVTTNDRSYIGPIRAVAVGGSKQKLSDLQILLGGFNSANNKVQVLSYVNRINMGTDLPPGKLLVDLWPTESRVQEVQAMGRVFRLIFDPQTKRPKVARVITYDDPDMPKQYSCLDALGLKPGQRSLGHQQEYVPQSKALPFEFTEVSAHVAAGDVGKLVLSHDTNVEYANDPEDPLLSFDEACKMLGLDMTIADYYLQELGYGSRPTLTASDYLAFAELIGEETGIKSVVKEEKTPEAVQPHEMREHPEAGFPPELYISAEEFAARSGWRGTLASFIKGLREQDVPLERQRTADKTTYFIPRNIVPKEYQ